MSFRMIIMCCVTILTKLVLDDFFFVKIDFFFLVFSKFKLDQLIKTLIGFLILLFKFRNSIFSFDFLDDRSFGHFGVLCIDLGHLIFIFKSRQWIDIFVSLKSLSFLMHSQPFTVSKGTSSRSNWRFPHIKLSLYPLLSPLTTRTIFFRVRMVDHGFGYLFGCCHHPTRWWFWCRDHCWFTSLDGLSH